MQNRKDLFWLACMLATSFIAGQTAAYAQYGSNSFNPGTARPDGSKLGVEYPAETLLRNSSTRPNSGNIISSKPISGSARNASAEPMAPMLNGAEATRKTPRPSIPDASKLGIELPLKKLLRNSTEMPRPTERILNGLFNPELVAVRPRAVPPAEAAVPTGPRAVLAAERAVPPAAGQYGCKVPAGRVNWHADFNKALMSAKVSRKPVLLFQMMGKLDDEFC